MKSIVICGGHTARWSEHGAVNTIDLEGIPITVGQTDAEEPIFDRLAPENRSAVLLKVRAFSCNYRDKTIMLKLWKESREMPTYTSIGSEFAGEVIATGPDVTRFRVGDRVMGDNHYVNQSSVDFTIGVPSNNSSKRYCILPEAKLIAIPPQMSDEVAAAFSIGAQTTYSMIRKLHLQPGMSVLLTAATSNTSLFALQALCHSKVDVYATTTSNRHREALQQLGAREVIVVDPTISSFRHYPQLDAVVQHQGGFHAAVDPFYDLYLHKAVEVLAADGKYITCGIADRYSHITGRSMYAEPSHFKELMHRAILKNIQIIGNCIGHSEDLRRAIDDYQSGSLDILIDSVFHGDQIAAFFERTYNAPDRFGKVVYSYDG